MQYENENMNIEKLKKSISFTSFADGTFVKIFSKLMRIDKKIISFTLTKKEDIDTLRCIVKYEMHEDTSGYDIVYSGCEDTGKYLGYYDWEFDPNEKDRLCICSMKIEDVEKVINNLSLIVGTIKATPSEVEDL